MPEREYIYKPRRKSLAMGGAIVCLGVIGTGFGAYQATTDDTSTGLGEVLLSSTVAVIGAGPFGREAKRKRELRINQIILERTEKLRDLHEAWQNEILDRTDGSSIIEGEYRVLDNGEPQRITSKHQSPAQG